MWIFRKYAKIEPLEYNDFTKGILDGKCYFFPYDKGSWRPGMASVSNGIICSLWWKMGNWIYEHKKTGCLGMGYNNKEIKDEEESQIFRAFILSDMEKVYAPFFRRHNDLMLFGVFYEDDVFDNELVFEVWDVYDFNEEKYMCYDDYSELLDLYKIRYTPSFAALMNPTYKDIVKLSSKKSDFLIKNYSFKEKIWAKFYLRGFNKEYYARGYKKDYPERSS